VSGFCKACRCVSRLALSWLELPFQSQECCVFSIGVFVSPGQLFWALPSPGGGFLSHVSKSSEMHTGRPWESDSFWLEKSSANSFVLL